MITNKIDHGNTKTNGSYVNNVYWTAIDYPTINPIIKPIILLESTKTKDSAV